MIRALILAILLAGIAVLVIIRPGTPLRWAARTWYRGALRGAPVSQVPEWIAYYVWGLPGDPMPRSLGALQDSVRTFAILALGIPVALILIVQLI